MRILMIHPGPEFSVQDVHTGWAEALRKLGCQVAEFNTHDRLTFYCKALLMTGENDEDGRPIVKQAMSEDDALLASMQGISHALYTFWPDVVIAVSAFFTTAGQLQLMRTRRHKIVLIHTESPYQDDDQLQRAPFADINLLNDPTNIEKYEELGIPAYYQHHCYRPNIHYPRLGPLDPEKASDFCFIGTAFKSRIKFFEAMNFDRIDVLLGGNCWGDTDPDSKLRRYLGHSLDECVDNDVTAEHYRHSKIGLNVYRKEGEGTYSGAAWAMGPREVEMSAIGFPFLRDSRAEGDEILPMLPRFSGPEEASDMLHYYLNHPAALTHMALAARAAISDRTFENSAKRLLRMLDDL